MKHFRIHVAALVLTLCSLPLSAQFDGNPEARTVYQQGEEAWMNEHYAEAAEAFQRAFSFDPDFVDAYQHYIWARNKAALQLLAQRDGETRTEQIRKEQEALDQVTQNLAQYFQGLSLQHPGKAVYLWALGQLYIKSDPLRQEIYCRQAIHVDSGFAPGYECLANIAYLRGDEEQVTALWRKVMELEPGNVEPAFYYSWELQGEPDAYHDATMQLIRKFPQSPRSAQALYWYAVHQRTDATAQQYFEQLLKLFPPAHFDWSAGGAELLFYIYDRTDPAKAQTLAHNMLGTFPKDKDWTAFALYADSMAKAEQEIKENHPTAAVVTLQNVKSPGFQFDMRRRELLYALALDLAGKTSQAYATLLADEALHPTAEIRTALEQYGAKLGMNSQQVDAALWSAIKANSLPSTPFTLQAFADGKPVSLASYRGHVVLVDFWYPNCGPCWQTFPLLQQIAAKYKDKGLVVLAINVMVAQEAFVLPLLKNQGYDFIPLKGNQEWADSVYHVQVFPSTFLIGEDGRVYFRPLIDSYVEERTAELEVDELLAHSGR